MFIGEIEKDEVNKLSEFVNAFPNEPITIYLESGGGSLAYARVFKDMITSHPDVTLVACHFIGSAAFDLFKAFEGKRKMTRLTSGMTHYSYKPFTLDERGKFVYNDANATLKTLKNVRSNSDAKAKRYMNNKEFKKFKKGKDVLFQPDRMEVIFKGVELI